MKPVRYRFSPRRAPLSHGTRVSDALVSLRPFRSTAFVQTNLPVSQFATHIAACSVTFFAAIRSFLEKKRRLIHAEPAGEREELCIASVRKGGTLNSRIGQSAFDRQR